MFYIAFGIWFLFVLLPCYVAGSSRIARANDEIDASKPAHLKVA